MSTLFSSNADYYRFFANEARRGGSPLYEALSLGIAEDPTLQQLAAKRRQGQPAANLIFAAVHFLLLGGADEPLKDYYPSVGGSKAPDKRVFGLFAGFCRIYKDEILQIISSRVTNTNEVGRSALLAPAFDLVANEAQAPLALIEIGSSAGFNLNFDHYGYRYLNDAGIPVLERRLDKSFVISCTLKGSGVPMLTETAPAVGSKLGLELAPIDITREENRRWLKALIWPERTDRLAKLDGALKVAALHPPRIRGGDGIAALPRALAEVPADQARCVFHTVMAYQLSREQQIAIHQALINASATSTVWRVTAEGEVTGPNPLETITPLKIHRYAKGQYAKRTLAICDPHGLWMEWKAE